MTDTETGSTDAPVLALQRARRQLQAWCARRNARLEPGHAWCLTAQGETFLVEACAGAVPVFRLCFKAPHWQLFIPRADGGWHPYAPRPEVTSVEAVIDELEQAPLHIHW